MKRLDLKALTPVGRGMSQMMLGGCFALAAAVLGSLEIVGNYLSARDELFQTVNRHRVLIPGAVIQPFGSLIGTGLRFFPLFWLFLGLEVVSAYRYHKKGSKSIYLMRRLPDRWELHRRCWGLPVVCWAGSAALMGVLLALYFVIYLVFTPAECLPY